MRAVLVYQNYIRPDFRAVCRECNPPSTLDRRPAHRASSVPELLTTSGAVYRAPPKRGPGHYTRSLRGQVLVGNVPQHRSLPRKYCRRADPGVARTNRVVLQSDVPTQAVHRGGVHIAGSSVSSNDKHVLNLSKVVLQRRSV